MRAKSRWMLVGAGASAGYRDVKVLGKFSAETGGTPLSMVVEVQVLDAGFLKVKKCMHKPFTILRGDFW